MKHHKRDVINGPPEETPALLWSVLPLRITVLRILVSRRHHQPCPGSISLSMICGWWPSGRRVVFQMSWCSCRCQTWQDLAWQLESLPSADGEAVSQLFQSLSMTKTTDVKTRSAYSYWCSKGCVDCFNLHRIFIHFTFEHGSTQLLNTG